MVEWTEDESQAWRRGLDSAAGELSKDDAVYLDSFTFSLVVDRSGTEEFEQAGFRALLK